MTIDDSEEPSRRGRNRVSLLALMLTWLLVPVGMANAQDRPVVESVRAGYPVQEAAASAGDRAASAKRRVRLGAWTPVWIALRGGKTAFQGHVELACPDDDDIPVVLQIPVQVGAGESITVSGLVRPGSSRPSLDVRLIDGEGGKRRASRSTNWPLEPPLAASRLLVLGAGQTPGLAEVASLLKFQGARGGLAVGTLDEMPSAWYGLDGVEAVALATANPEAAEFLKPGRIEVLRSWVAQGGHLVISLGAENWEGAASALGDLLPARALGRLTLAEISDLGALESFAGNVSRPIPPPLEVVRLETVSRTGATTLAAVAATPLVVRGAYGFGRVTVMGLDVTRPPFSTWPDRPLVWDRLLDLQVRGSDTSSIAGSSRGALIQQANPDLAARLHQALGAFPGVKLVPFGWVALLIFLYLLAIGPLDYFLLRRVFKRMELTWLTFPLVVGLTSALAFAAAHALKGDQLRINKIDLLDVDQSRGTIRGQSWVTAFSPGNLDYRVSVEPRSPELGRVAEGVEPAWLGSNTVSWFGPPEAGLSGVGRVALGNSRSIYEPAGQLAELSDVRIPIWSTKSFVSRWAGDAPGTRLIEAELRTVAGDRLTGSVRNLLDYTLKDARLFYGRNVYELGTVRPRGIARVNPTRTEAASRHLGRVLQTADKRPSGGATTAGTPEDRAALRIELVRAVLFRNALGSRAEEYPSFPLRKLDLTDQASELRRPILVAEVDAPAGALRLEGWSGEPERSESTVLRVILTLDEIVIGSADTNTVTPSIDRATP